MSTPTITRVAVPATRGWLPLLILPALVLALAPADMPRWLLMWLLLFAVFFGFKWLTFRNVVTNHVPAWLRLGYFIGWPGLDAAAFFGERAPGLPRAAEWLAALAKTLLGAGLVWAAAVAMAEEPVFVRCWLGLIGLGLLLHCGFLHLLSCLWRALGRDARPLMDRPFVAVRLGEFWGRRWNTAFRDVTERFLFQPLRSVLGPRAAVMAGFALSGLLHDLVISVPAGGGYGWPTLYFLLQGAALLAQRSPLARKLRLERGLPGWLCTQTVVILPAVLLFHDPFLHNVVAPFLNTLGAR